MHRAIVFGGVVGERLGDEDAGVVDQRVDAAEARDRLRDDALGGRRIGDVAGDGQDVRIGGRLDRAGIGDDAVVAVAVRLDQAAPMPCDAPVMMATFCSVPMIWSP